MQRFASELTKNKKFAGLYEGTFLRSNFQRLCKNRCEIKFNVSKPNKLIILEIVLSFELHIQVESGKRS